MNWESIATIIAGVAIFVFMAWHTMPRIRRCHFCGGSYFKATAGYMGDNRLWMMQCQECHSAGPPTTTKESCEKFWRNR